MVEAGGLQRRAFLGAGATDDEQTLADGRNEEVLQAADQATAAATAIEAIQVVRAGDYDRARDMLHEAEARMSKSGGSADYREEMRELAEAMPVSEEPSEASEDAPDGDVEPVAAPPPSVEVERSLRRVHSRSMDALGY